MYKNYSKGHDNYCKRSAMVEVRL
ncbi:MAG: hypothetical protein AWU54_2210, partial [Candidatus Frackibacter sp. T328-2]